MVAAESVAHLRWLAERGDILCYTKRTTRWRVCATGLPPHARPRAFTSRALLAGRLAFRRTRDDRVRRVDADAARERAGDLRVRDRRVPVARAGRPNVATFSATRKEQPGGAFAPPGCLLTLVRERLHREPYWQAGSPSDAPVTTGFVVLMPTPHENGLAICVCVTVAYQLPVPAGRTWRHSLLHEKNNPVARLRHRVASSRSSESVYIESLTGRPARLQTHP